MVAAAAAAAAAALGAVHIRFNVALSLEGRMLHCYSYRPSVRPSRAC